MKKRGRKRISDPDYLATKATRITFRVDPELATKFKAVAAMKKLTIEQFGLMSMKNLIKKEKKSVMNWSTNDD